MHPEELHRLTYEGLQILRYEGSSVCADPDAPAAGQDASGSLSLAP